MATKEIILQTLENSRGIPVSGQALADKIGVSRTAVWKAINTLKGQGYPIDGTPNSGYVLADSSDKLNGAVISRYLERDLELVTFDEIDSTNSYAKQAADKYKGTALIVANSQTSGRGRLGKSFYSPADTGLYMSLLLHPHRSFGELSMVTVMTAVFVCEALKALGVDEPQIKWVNDIYIGGKKVCGILTEATGSFENGIVESLIVGIGVNVTTDAFPDKLGDIATATGSISRAQLAAEITNRFLDAFDSGRDVMDSYRAYSCILGKKIFYNKNGVQQTALAVDFNESGNLLVRLDSGEIEVLVSGEVSVRPLASD